MITKDGKILNKINIFDFIIALLIALMIFIFFNNKIAENKEVFEDKSLPTVDITYNLIIKNVRDVTANAFIENEPVFDYKLDNKIGVIKNITVEPAKGLMKLFDGRIINAPIEDRYDVILTIKATAVKQSNGDLMIGKNNIVEGFEIGLATQKCKCIAIIREV
jgi:hypothetical protein